MTAVSISLVQSAVFDVCLPRLGVQFGGPWQLQRAAEGWRRIAVSAAHSAQPGACAPEDEEEAFPGAGVHLLAGESAQQAPHAGALVPVLFGAHPSSPRVLTNAATTSDYPKLGDACVHHSTSLSTVPRILGC